MDGGQRIARGRWDAAVEEAFLEALSACGNARAAAGAVGFSAATAFAKRRERPEFGERWTTALAARRKRRPSGSIVRYARASMAAGEPSRAKRVRCLTQWSEEIEELFLDVLSATCNVGLAAEEAGVGHTSVYRQRRLRADFAAKWQAALEQGYARLEMGLVEAANDSLATTEFDAERPIPRMSAETAIRLLQLHRAAVTGAGRKSGWQARPRTLDEVRASIEKKVRAIKAARVSVEAHDAGESKEEDGSRIKSGMTG